MSRIPALLFVLAAPAAAASLPEPPSIDARAWLLIEHRSGGVLAARDPGLPVEPASVTKIMAAYLVADALATGALALDEKVKISERAWRAEGSRTFVAVGSRVKVEDLVRGMIVQSGNDATIALAERIAGSEVEFARRMTETARALGATGTHFVNASGLPDPRHYSTAGDLALMTSALIRNYPEMYARFAEREFTYDGIRQRNRNSLLGRDPSVDGVKTGYHEVAGYTFVASAERDGMRLIAVTLGSPSDRARDRAARSLLEWGFKEFELHRVYAAAQRIGTARVWKGAADTVPLGPEQDVWVAVPRGRYAELRAFMDLAPRIMAPIAPDERLGTLRVMLGNLALAQSRLYALAPVPEGDRLRKLVDTARLLIE